MRDLEAFRGRVSNSPEVEPLGYETRAIVEANSWIIPSDGTIELVFDPQVLRAQLQAAMGNCNGYPLNYR